MSASPPLTEVYSLNIPRLPLGGGTDYGEAFTCLMREIDRNVVKTTINQKGDWKPLVFSLLTAIRLPRPTKEYSINGVMNIPEKLR